MREYQMKNELIRCCGKCMYYNGDPGDGEQFCDKKEEVEKK